MGNMWEARERYTKVTFFHKFDRYGEQPLLSAMACEPFLCCDYHTHGAGESPPREPTIRCHDDIYLSLILVQGLPSLGEHDNITSRVLVCPPRPSAS